MTYRSRGRSIFEVILAICFVGFLVGFITVLCIGNYFRAKRAQERQRQRRLAKLSNAVHNGGRSPRTNTSANPMHTMNSSSGMGYEAPPLEEGINVGISA
mmetsp:Transcript_12894/g.18409  ORF Transcript_12894/g.18409 Transcript_12894/m.18409 type:complete len:100 (+) Transcript_12894:184-483(+)